MPLDRVDQVVDDLLELSEKYKREYGHNRQLPFSLRPVKADSLGYLSPTKHRDTCFVDIPYEVLDPDSVILGFYKEAEEVLLRYEGRVSWSRLFWSKPADIIPSYPEFTSFVEVKKQLDPLNLFSNEFSDRFLFPGSA